MSEKLEKSLLRYTFFVKLQTPSLKLCQKMNPITNILEVICLHLRSPCLKVDIKVKSHNFEIEWILCYSKYFVLYFQQLQVPRWSDGWSIFYEKKKSCLNNTVCFRVKTQSGKCTAWYIKTIWKLQYQFPDAKINWL